MNGQYDVVWTVVHYLQAAGTHLLIDISVPWQKVLVGGDASSNACVWILFYFR